MVRSEMRTAFASALAFVIVCLATGCGLVDAHDEALLAIRRDDENLMVAVCGTIEAMHLTMEERNLSEGRDWQIFWERDAFRVTPDQPFLANRLRRGHCRRNHIRRNRTGSEHHVYFLPRTRLSDPRARMAALGRQNHNLSL